MDRVEGQSNQVKSFSASEEVNAYRELESTLTNSPVFPDEKLANLGLFLTRPSMSRILFMHDLYQKILNVPGVILELGCHWGQNMALFTTFRTIYEPHNISRRIIGFDTFEGFPQPSAEDGPMLEVAASSRACDVSERFEDTLDRILDCHNALGPRAHIKKHEVIKGDVTETLPAYLERNPETLIAMVYLDLGLYEPTRRSLELVKDRLCKGSVVGLDQIAMHEVPGDSRAVMEVLGYRNCRFVRDPRVPYQSYFVVE